ncbi:hypothetical protein [Peredibacter starrii]|uniref:Radical SAM protein n=1 Tax=Peredibacter starrii TaxID=28202 RepID=A0AAX4HRH0_9BACT|nr:hypothetical protein [Peredibacter starrii]WPU65625.1 hypothetical protein SOO65_02575 [Peredibacter starrii]
MIRKNLFERMNIAGHVNVELQRSSNFYVFMNVDLLNGCGQTCAGCFVNKGINSYDLNRDLETIARLADEVNASNLHLEEIALGPTDFFSAKNTLEVITHPAFKRLFKNEDTKFVMTSTLKASGEEIRQKLKVLEESVGHLDIDLLIATDIDEFLTNKQYLQEMKSKWQILKESSLEFDPAFQINIHPANLIKYNPDNLTRLAQEIKAEFDTILEFNPSILRIKHQKQKDNLKFWMRTIRENSLKNANNFTYTMVNKSHSGMNNLVVNFREGNFYLCPFIYENVFSYEDSFLIQKQQSEYTLSDLLESKENSFVKQMNYSSKTNHCEGCEYLVSCTYKNVLTYMEANEIKDCFLGLGNGEAHGRAV